VREQISDDLLSVFLRIVSASSAVNTKSHRGVAKDAKKTQRMVVVRFDSLSHLGEGWGEGLSANCNYNVAAGFSPQSVQRFFQHQPP